MTKMSKKTLDTRDRGKWGYEKLIKGGDLYCMVHLPHSSSNIDSYVLLLSKLLQIFVIKHIYI